MVFLLACSANTAASLTIEFKKQSTKSLVQSQTLSEILLIPPLRASLLILPLVSEDLTTFLISPRLTDFFPALPLPAILLINYLIITASLQTIQTASKIFQILNKFYRTDRLFYWNQLIVLYIFGLSITYNIISYPFPNIFNKPFDNLIKLEKLTTLNINKPMTTLRPTDLGILNSTVNQVPIQSISWSKFKGQVPECPHYHAHIFWNIEYKINLDDNNRAVVLPKVCITGRSWALEDKVNDKLLQHQYGHYLIGCLCALKFKQKVQKSDTVYWNKSQALKECQQIFKQTLNQYLKIEIQYDDQTQHYYNECKQIEWQSWIASQINKLDKDSGEDRKENIKMYGNEEGNRRSKQRTRKSSFQQTSIILSQEKNKNILKTRISSQKGNRNSNKITSVQKKQSSTSKSINKYSKEKSLCTSAQINSNKNIPKERKNVSMEISHKCQTEQETAKLKPSSCKNIRIRKTSLSYGAYPPLPPAKLAIVDVSCV